MIQRKENEQWTQVNMPRAKELQAEVNAMTHVIMEHTRQRPETQKAFFTVIGYATMVIMHHAVSTSGGDFNEIAKNYRDFLARAAQDVDNAVKRENDGQQGDKGAN